MLQLICVDNALVICGFDGQILHMSSNPQTGETCTRELFERNLIPGLRDAEVCQCFWCLRVLVSVCLTVCVYV